MKKRSSLVAVLLLLASAPMFNSCFIGSFSCLHKLIDFNENLTSNRFINGIVGFFIGPFEFSVGGFLDTVIFNTLEFWTGSNPMAATQVVEAQDGNLYAIAPNGQGGYTITCQQTGRQMEYLFEADTHTWSASFDGQEIKLFSLNTPEEAVVYVPGAEAITISLNEEGLLACQQAFENTYLAMK